MPHLAFVNAHGAGTRSRRSIASAQVGTYRPAVAYPNNGFGQALQAVAGAMVNGVGTSVFWVQTGGYDTHAGQNTNQANGAYTSLMATLNDGLFAFYNDLHATRGCSATRWCCSSPSSAGASPRTAATAPTTAPPA